MQGTRGSFFAHFLDSSHLVDIKPPKVSSTWCNGRKGTKAISKCIDIFLLSESMVGGPWTLESSVNSRSLSDHFPIILNLVPKELKPPYPLKFNHIWLT
jgi:hypothetical protein